MFIWLCQALVASGGIFIASCGIFSCNMWVLVCRPGIELRPPALGAWSLSHWPLGKSQYLWIRLAHSRTLVNGSLFSFPFFPFLSLCDVTGASQVSLVVKYPPANAGDLRDLSSVSGSGISPGESPGQGNGRAFQYSCLENLMDRGAWWPTYSPQILKDVDTTEVPLLLCVLLIKSFQLVLNFLPKLQK